MIRIRQLSGGGLYGDIPYWIKTTWFGVLFETASFWLKHCGWGVWRCGCGYGACDHVHLRLRLKGRCWIEDVDHPAVAIPDGVQIVGKFPTPPPIQYVTAPRKKRAVKRRTA